MARVLHLISSNERRGAEVFACELADHLRSVGHDVRVLAVAPTTSGKVLDVEVAGASRSDPRGAARALAAARWADVVVSFGSTSLITGAVVAKLARRPFVYRNIGDPGVWGAARFANLRIGAPVRSAARVVALYPDARDTLLTRYRLDPDRIRIIPRGVPAERFAPAEPGERRAARDALGLAPDRRWLAYVGALSPEKDPGLALEVLRRLPDDIGLVVAGGGSLEEELRTDGTALGDRLVMLGSVSDVRSVFAAADLLVLTSRTEGIPGAVIEAGLSGLATVATAVGGVPHVIDDGRSGRLVPLDRPDEFAEAVLDALTRAPQLGDAAHEKCTSEYSMANVGRAWEHVIADLTSTPGRRLLQVVASTQRRGAEVFANQLDEALTAQGWSVRTASVSPATADAGLSFTALGTGRFRPSTLLRMARAARRSDIVVAHGSNSLLPVMLVAKLCRRPFAYRNIGDPAHWGNVPLANWRIGFPLRRADAVITLSEPARAWIARKYSVKDERIAVIPNGVTVAGFPQVDVTDRREARERLGLPADAAVLGYLGSLTPEKRPEWAVRAVAARPGAILLIGGDGIMRAELEDLAATVAPGQVRFLGVLGDSRTFYAAIDLLLLPSVTEGMPAVAIEAGLSGVPTVATDVGAVREVLLDHGSGTVVPSDEGSFVGAVAGADIGLRVAPQTAATLAADYGMDRIAEHWDGVLERIRRHAADPTS